LRSALALQREFAGFAPGEVQIPRRLPWHLACRPLGASTASARLRPRLTTRKGLSMASSERTARGGALGAYRESLSGLCALERDVERDLAHAWAAGDARAGARLVEACLPFVVSIALAYRRWGVPLEDIIQQGNLGLLKAAARFDTARECRLATYAAYWIRAEIRDYVVRAFRVVRLGTTKGERRALRAFRRGQATEPERLAELSGLSEERVRLLLPLLASKEVSLDASSADMAPAIERLASSGASPEDETARTERVARTGRAVRAAVEELDERERLIVRERFMTDDPPTLQELGARLGVSKERVRQLEARARLKLRGGLAAFAAEVA
jgi:RNA polymerase sigma-32 factor